LKFYLTQKNVIICNFFTKIELFLYLKYIMKLYKLFAVLLFIGFSGNSQQKITIEEIYRGTFRTKVMDELQSLKNTNQYTVLNFDKTSKTFQIDLYDFSTLKLSLIHI
jgi:dipeptidyl-peptidase-4